MATFTEFLHYLLDRAGGPDEGLVAAWHKRIDDGFAEVEGEDSPPIRAAATVEPAPPWAADMAKMTSVLDALAAKVLGEQPAPSEPAAAEAAAGGS